WEQRRWGDAGTLRELEEKERERDAHQHRGRYTGVRRRPRYTPALDGESGVEALAKVGGRSNGGCGVQGLHRLADRRVVAATRRAMGQMPCKPALVLGGRNYPFPEIAVPFEEFLAKP